MQRDFASLERPDLDVLVIGGGILGAWTALDAAQRGLRVALVEERDWASSTSSSSSKLIHGGLRYLERFEVSLVRRALAERRILTEIAPHRVWPLRFLLPVYRGDRVGPFKLRLGLGLYDLLAATSGRQPVGRHERLDVDEIRERYPFVRDEGLRAGFTYGDCQTDDARLVLEVVDAALREGASCVNHASAVEWIREDGRTAGAVVEDRVGGATIDVRARTVVYAGGVHAELLAQAYPGARDLFRTTKGVHILLPALPTRDAMLLVARSDGRVFFVIPWYGRTMVGTTDTDYQGDPREVHAEPEDIRYLLEETGRALRGIDHDESDVLGAFAGLRMLARADGPPSSVSRDATLHELDEGLLLLVGGKLTTARHEAELIVDRVARRASRTVSPSRSASTPLPWSLGASLRPRLLERGLALGIESDIAETALGRYGSRAAELFDRVAQDPASAARIANGTPFCRAEIEFCRSSEMVVHEEDLFRRRLPLDILSPGSRDERVRSETADA